MASQTYLATYRTNYASQIRHEKRMIRTTFPAKHTSVVDGTKPVWMWLDGFVNGIRLSNEQPDQSLNARYVPYISPNIDKRYGRDSRATCFTRALYEPVGIEAGSCVSVFEDGNELLYKVSTPEERISAQTKSEKTIDGKVKCGRNIRFTKSTMNMMGISYYDDVVVKINTVNGCWMEITKAPPGYETPGMRGVLKSLGLQVRETVLNIEYKANYGQGMLFLPAAFLKKGRVKNNDILPFRVEGETVIIEGNPIQCQICGKYFSQYKHEIGTLKVCSKCRIEVDKSYDIITLAQNEVVENTEGLTRISKKKVSGNNQVSLGTEHAEKQFNVFIGDKSIKLTQEPCTDPSYIKRSYRNGMILLTCRALSEAGLKAGDKLTMLEKDGEIVLALPGISFTPIRKPKTLTIDVTEPFVPSDDYIEVPVRADGKKKNFSLPNELLELAGIENEVEVKVNNNTGQWLEITKLSDTNLESRIGVFQRLGNAIAYADGVVYQDVLHGKFKKHMRISNNIIKTFGAVDSNLKLWYNSGKNCIVAEAPSQRCDINGEEIKSLPAIAETLDVCHSCLGEIVQDAA
jgi:hypothetical protein